MSRRLLAVLVTATLVLGACGDDDDGETSSGGDAGGAAPAEVETDRGVTDDEIRVGIFNGFTGPISALALPAAAGVDAYFAKINDAGGVCGRDVVAVRGDTQYDPQVAVQVYRAEKDNVVMIGQLVGASTIFGLSEQIARDRILTFAATTAASVIPLDNIYTFITPAPMFVINGLSWAEENLAGDDGRLEVGIIYQGDAFGEEGLAALEYLEANDDDVEIVAQASYATTDEDFTAQVQEMKDGGAEVVWLHAISAKTSRILSQASQLGYDPYWMGVDSSYANPLAEQLGSLLDKYRVVSANVAYGEDVPEMAEMQQYLDQVAPGTNPDQIIVTGWVNASVQVAVLEKACENGDLTQAGVLEAMEGLEVPATDLGPQLVYGTGDADSRIPSRETRVNEIDLETSFPVPLSDFASSPLADEWTLADGE